MSESEHSPTCNHILRSWLWFFCILVQQGADDANAFFRWSSCSLKNAIPLAYSALLDLDLLLSAKALYPYLVPHRAPGLTAEARFAKAKTVAGLQLQQAIDQLSKLSAEDFRQVLRALA